jgi:hypothetical protein
MEVFNRLRGEAEIVLAGANRSPEDAQTNERFLRGMNACETVLVNLDSSASDRA